MRIMSLEYNPNKAQMDYVLKNYHTDIEKLKRVLKEMED